MGKDMLLKIDHASNQPLHDQVAAQLRTAIASGELSPGERLPPSRDLAQGLDVNMHTVLRALATLRDEGLVDVRRGRGTTVTGQAPLLAGVVELVHTLVVEARRQGISDPQLRTLLDEAL